MSRSLFPVAPGARIAVLLLAVAALVPVPAGAGVGAEEYAARRQRLADQLGPDALLVLVAPEPAVRHGDVFWPFRQDDELLYLTGIDQPGTALAMLPGEADHREVLFTLERDPASEVWDGPLMSTEQAAAVSGIDEVAPQHRLGAFIEAALGGRWWGETDLYRYYRVPGMPRFLEAVRAGRAELWLDLADRGAPGAPPSSAQRLADDLRRRYPEIAVRDVSPRVTALREVKSPAEVELIQRAIDVTVEAQTEAMRRALTAEHEYQLQATIEYVFRDRGACCWGFPSIVASGRNTTILHYPEADGPVVRDGLMLFDVGAEVEGYTADVTRTFPADGTFSPEQRAVYEVVLTAWRECLPLIRPGALYAEVHRCTESVIARELAALGLVSEPVPEQARLYFVHGVGHPLGLEVHDVFDTARPLEPGMVWTIEPGVYVRRGDVEASPELAALSEEARAGIRAALDRYDGIGVRIEDDVLVTEGAPRVLSDGLPRSVEGLEALLAEGPVE